MAAQPRLKTIRTEEVERFHRETKAALVHAHPLLNMQLLGRDIGRRHAAPFLYNPLASHLDLPRLEEGGVDVLVFAVYPIPHPLNWRRRDAATFEILDLFDRFVREHSSRIGLALNAGDVERITGEGRIAALLSIEGGHSLEGKLENLTRFHARGVRSLTLTHFLSNAVAAASYQPWRRADGLTPLGRDVVREMNRLRMIVDLAHCTDRAFQEAAELSTAPVMSSHTGVRRLCPMERNLSDEQIRLIAAKGGLVGIIFCPWYLESRGLLTGIDRLVDHIEYVADLVGPEYVCLGSDFDGYIWTVRGLKDVADLPQITVRLFERGFTREEVRLILRGNFLRVLKKVCG